MKRFDIINEIINKYKYKTYLEIGAGNHDCFDQIICESKISVDPSVGSPATFNQTSDRFFNENELTFDLIFIDGLHEAKQCFNDMANALGAMNAGSTIVCHDMNPPNKENQMVPRITAAWTGDVWQAWAMVRSENKFLSMFVIDTDWGVGVIREGEQILYPIPEDFTWEWFFLNRKNMLNLHDTKWFLEWLTR